jgi:predicted nucleic acid-binding protein
MPFVVDASVALAWALQEVHTTATLALQRIRNDEAIVPSLWWFELRNGLVINERRGRITTIETARFLRRIARVLISVDLAPGETTVLDLARRHRLTVYDASYLELALREDLPMATLDVALVRAARAEAVPLIGA